MCFRNRIIKTGVYNKVSPKVDIKKTFYLLFGDTLDKAVYTGVELATFNNSDVFYEKRDTLVKEVLYPGVYVYSIDPEKAKYRIRFSNVEPEMEITTKWVLQPMKIIYLGSPCKRPTNWFLRACNSDGNAKTKPKW